MEANFFPFLNSPTLRSLMNSEPSQYSSPSSLYIKNNCSPKSKQQSPDKFPAGAIPTKNSINMYIEKILAMEYTIRNL